MELKRMMIWLMCWTTSFEEAESLGRDRLKNCELVFILFLSLLVFVCYLIVIELDFVLSLSVFVCYLIAMKLYCF